MSQNSLHLKNSSLTLITIYQKAIKELMENYQRSATTILQDVFNTQNLYQEWVLSAFSKPEKIMSAQINLLEDYLALNSHLSKWILDKKIPDFISETDKRFKGVDWRENIVFYYLHQWYLVTVKNSLEFVENNPSDNKHLNQQVLFYTKQFMDAMSPSNFILTNPHVIKKSLETKGESLTKGFTNFLEDISKGKGHWNIKMSDTSAFKIGQNLAVTPGKVIYQNRLMQLIQYSATTAKVDKLPLLIVPPWINKYYILDLTEKNSFAKWIVDQGVTVFMISWVNPDASFKDTTFEDYLFEGIISALDVIQEVTDVKKVNALGFCIGGTLLAMALAYLQGKGQKRIESATFLTTLIDFSESGDLGIILDEEKIASIESRMEKEGFLDGRLLMTTFNLLRANELFWSFYVKNYLCGQDPFSFDLLYWNCDSTNLPAKMHSYYLRNMYLNNNLAKNGLFIDGVKIDLKKVDIPCYFLSTEQDHIAPWKSTFTSAQCLGGPVTFVLAGSGHIAGVVNPPINHKYYFNYDPNEINLSHYEKESMWLENTTKVEGSWWENWINWLRKPSQEKVPARLPGSQRFVPIEDAPGTYVKKTL